MDPQHRIEIYLKKKDGVLLFFKLTPPDFSFDVKCLRLGTGQLRSGLFVDCGLHATQPLACTSRTDPNGVA